MRIEIDGRAVRTERDVHQALADQLDFGPYYGFNLAALRDRLSLDIERPIELVWTNASARSEALGVELFGRIVALLADVAADDVRLRLPERFTFEVR